MITAFKDLERFGRAGPGINPIGVGHIDQAIVAGMHHQRSPLEPGQFGLMIKRLLDGCLQLGLTYVQLVRRDPQQKAFQRIGDAALDDQAGDMGEARRRVDGINRADGASK